MRKALALLLLATTPAWAANYATCVLDKAPGIANEPAAYAVAQLCRSEHPGGLNAVQQGSGKGWFGFKSGAECITKKAGDTRSNQAALMIGAACRKLYDEDGPWNKHPPLKPFTGKLDGES